MKSALKRFIKKTASREVFWRIYSKCSVLSLHIEKIYGIASSARDGSVFDTEDFIERSFPDLVVRNGPFKGMKYPSAKSSGSMILPKLLGSYEAELDDVFTKILKNDYTDIVDIGCAEGYYAVGMGMRFPKAKIYGYDSDEGARTLCRDMAKLNRVLDRFVLGSFCDEAALLSMSFKGKALVISDCEGYEKTLFSAKVAQFLAPHDLLIEVHDLIDPEISATLRKNFEKTHDIFAVESIDDGKKAKFYNYGELEPYNIRERYIILAEERKFMMEWFYLTPKRVSES